MAQPLRIEDKNRVFLITTRTIASRLWFVSNPELEIKVLSYLAKYQEQFEVELFAFVIMGNHYHLVARFPKCNKSNFMRAFNAIFARLTGEYVPSYHGGRLWARRFSEQVLAEECDITHWFYYCALNPVLSGLVSHPSQYKGYNSFDDAVKGRIRTFTIFERMAYNEAVRRGQNVTREQFMRNYSLKYSRLPEFDGLDNRSYTEALRKERLERNKEALKKLFSDGRIPRSSAVAVTKPGSFPRKTKISHRYSFRPLVLSLSIEAKKAFLEIYFNLRNAYREASARFRAGNLLVEFPPGTYRPPIFAT